MSAGLGSPKRGSVVVQASTLHRLAPLVPKREDIVFHSAQARGLAGWRVEPHADGGALVIATNGKSIGVIHDPKARATGPLTILATDGLRKAVTPPPPHTVYYPGDWEEVDLPAEFWPGTVIATRIGVFVSRLADDQRSDAQPAADTAESDETPMTYSEFAEDGDVWAGGFRLIDEYPDWRRPFANWKAPESVSPDLPIAPEILSAFRNVGDGLLDLVLGETTDAPVLVTSSQAPDFVGLFVLGRYVAKATALPAWLNPTTPEAAQ